MSNIITMHPRPITHAELNSLTEQRDKLVIECICRSVGSTTWALADMYPRGRWVRYTDGELCFLFDEEEKFLLKPLAFDRANQQWVQKVEFLYDRKDYDHQPMVATPEEEDIIAQMEEDGEEPDIEVDTNNEVTPEIEL
jgi:hypothetical protein